MNKWIGAGAAVLLALAAGGWRLSADIYSTQQRIETVEKRQDEDRSTYQREQREIKADVKQIGADVQQILRKMDVIEDRRRITEGFRR